MPSSSTPEPPPAAGPRPRRRYGWLILLLLIVSGGAAVAAAWFRSSDPDPDVVSTHTDTKGSPFDLGAGGSPGGAGEGTGGTANASQPEFQEDVWESEQFAEAVDEQLKTLAQLITDPASTLDATPLVTADCSVTSLRPAEMTPVHEGPYLAVFRPTRQQLKESVPPDQQGPEAVTSVLKTLGEPFRELSGTYVKFKVYSVEQTSEGIYTNVVYQAAGRQPQESGPQESVQQESVQQSGRWRCLWQRKQVPILKSLELLDYEEARGTAPTGGLFADCTRSIFRNEPTFESQLSLGIDHWRATIQAQHGVFPYGHHGVAVGDVNGDGLDDIYLCQPAGLPNRLYLQQPDGTVTDAARQWGVDWLDRSRGALLVDLDNDSDQDLVVTISEMIMVMANDGEGGFEERSVYRTTGDAGALAAADYDLDGDLDIYVAVYGKRFLSDGESDGPIPYHDANNGGQNILLRSDGDWKYTEVTRASGLDQNNRRFSFAAAWEDYDLDGDPDLYVANDFGRNNLYRNDEGRFVDVAKTAGVEDVGAGMSVSWADYNLDGKPDLYVGNMYSSAGQRIAHQERFQPESAAEVRSEFQRHARGSSLFQNEGDGSFSDVSVDEAVTLGRWAWDSRFIDINNDGLQDLVVTNGMVTGTVTKDL